MKQSWSKLEGKVPLKDKPLPDGNPNPVKQYHRGWYFWDETWTDAYGPFQSYNDCKDSCDLYSCLLGLSGHNGRP